MPKFLPGLRCPHQTRKSKKSHSDMGWCSLLLQCSSPYCMENRSGFVTMKFAFNQHQEICSNCFTIGFLLKKHDSAWLVLVSAQVFCSQAAWSKKKRSDAFTTHVLTFASQFGHGACPETAPTCSTVLTSIPITRRMNCKGETCTKHRYVQN